MKRSIRNNSAKTVTRSSETNLGQNRSEEQIRNQIRCDYQEQDYPLSALLQQDLPRSSPSETLAEVHALRTQMMTDKEAFLKTNVEVVAMNAKLLETISMYEKRCASLLADRERMCQAVATLQRQVSQLQGERDAMKTVMDQYVKGLRDEKDKTVPTRRPLQDLKGKQNLPAALQSSVFTVPTDDPENPQVHVAPREPTKPIKRKHKAKKGDSVSQWADKDMQFQSALIHDRYIH